MLALLAAFSFISCSSCSSNGEKVGYESDNYNDENNIIDNSEFEESSDNELLSETYSNSKFSIRYPSNWEVAYENMKVADNTTISVQIMQRVTNESFFAPNFNIIASKDKRYETTASLAKITYKQLKELGLEINLIDIHDCQIDGKNGSVMEYTLTFDGYKIRGYQYTVKKKDNSTFAITMAVDDNRLREQKPLAKRIINSIKIF